MDTIQALDNGEHFQTVTPGRHSYCCIWLHTGKVYFSLYRERSINLGCFLFCAQLANHGLKWAWMSECRFWKVTETVGHPFPYSDIRKVRRDLWSFFTIWQAVLMKHPGALKGTFAAFLCRCAFSVDGKCSHLMLHFFSYIVWVNMTEYRVSQNTVKCTLSHIIVCVKEILELVHSRLKKFQETRMS